MSLAKYSFGIGDRFGHEGIAQLQAVIQAREEGLSISPVWNKSNREHEIIGTAPADVRREADRAVKDLDWNESYFVDADHITMKSVDKFIHSSNFFTIDVAEFIGVGASREEVENFVDHNRAYIGKLTVTGIDEPLGVTEQILRSIAQNYLPAINEAEKIYTHIHSRKKEHVVTEVSMDEVDAPQSPIELFFILKTFAERDVILDTIAPKFTGRFNKGVDYVGDINHFRNELEQNLLIIAHIVKSYHLSKNIRISVHSGSDKFSLYGVINELIRKYRAGIHVKTSGTTWLQELTGLAISGDDGPSMIKYIYNEALKRYDELIEPYIEVTDIDRGNLPDGNQFNRLDGAGIMAVLQHDSNNPVYNADFRQLMHCAYRIAAEAGSDFIDLLDKYQDIIQPKVTENLFVRHIKPIFIGN